MDAQASYTWLVTRLPAVEFEEAKKRTSQSVKSVQNGHWPEDGDGYDRERYNNIITRLDVLFKDRLHPCHVIAAGYVEND